MIGEETNRNLRRIEAAANIAIVIAAVAIILFFLKVYASNKQDVKRAISPGTRFVLKDVDWGEKNVILGLSTTCHFCSESAGFYRRLVEECQRRHVRIIAVFPQPLNEAQAYLNGEGVAVNVVRQAVLRNLDITGTPTLLLVDRAGIVKNAWFGKLSSNKEEEVLAKLE